MSAAGLLLTGGASRRMGRKKAMIPSGHGGRDPLARRTAGLLCAATEPVIEVGPGYSGLPCVTEDPPGAGPLAAVAAGARELLRAGWRGGAVVLATDLPMLDPALIEWLVSHPDPRSIVPVVGGRAQPLCARYDRAALDAAVTLSDRGARAMRDLLGEVEHVLAGPEQWGAAGIAEVWFSDVDTPAELAATRSEAGS